VSEALPEPGAPPDPGTPEELVARRPDTVAAHKRWDAQKLRVTSSTLALLPTLQAQAGTGWNYAYSDSFDSLAGWSVGGTASVPLFNGGQTHAGIRSARAQRDQAVHAWNQAVLTAVSDVRTAAIRDRENRLRREAIGAQLEAGRMAYEESLERYLAGVDPFVTVLTSWNTLQQAEIGALQAHRDVLSARIAFFTALGGNGAPQ
jgi:multidrug efflux system outer membrane protein